MAQIVVKLGNIDARYYTRGVIKLNKKALELMYYKNIIVSTINRLTYDNGWTIKKLSENADLPYESVKKLVGGKITNPTIYSLIKISNAFDCGLDYLVSNESVYGPRIHLLPKRAVTLLNAIADFEIYLSQYNQKHLTDHITVLVPTGSVGDGMLFDSILTDSVDISAYRSDYGDIIMCGLKVVGDALHPTYLKNDILLIARDRFPLDGETGVFLIKHKAYIRKYISSTPVILAPVNGIGDSITVSNINDIHFFGRVLTIVRK